MPPEVWEAVPNVVASTISQVMGPDIPIDPQIAFRYYKNGRLPEFVLCYFMWLQKARRGTSKATIFGRALHYLEAFREYMLNASGVMEGYAGPGTSEDEDNDHVVGGQELPKKERDSPPQDEDEA